MAVPRRNGLREEDEEDEALFEEDDGLVLLPESDTPPHLRDLAAAAELGDLAALRRALGKSRRRGGHYLKKKKKTKRREATKRAEARERERRETKPIDQQERDEDDRSTVSRSLRFHQVRSINYQFDQTKTIDVCISFHQRRRRRRSINYQMFVEEVMELVELTPIKDFLVGLPGVDGLSTEQRKRLTIAVELVANPSIIFMDEPTSGLDARAAAIVMRTVRNTVDTGRTVVCTIHQPSIDIFESFDELLLMKRGGQVIYAGPLGRNSHLLVEYFESIPGVPKIKDGVNPATWMLEVTASSVEAQLGVDFAEIFAKSDLYQTNQELIKNLSMPAPGSQDLYFPTKYSQPFITQCMACFWKQHWSYWRNPQYNVTRFLMTTAIGIIFGLIFWKKGEQTHKQQDLTNLLGAMYVAVIFLGGTNTSGVQTIVAIERAAFYRERAAGMYSEMPYALAHVAIETIYVAIQTFIYSLILYSMIGFHWQAGKFLWFYFYVMMSFVYFTLYGMMLVALTPSYQIAAICMTFFMNFWNLFSGFMIARTQIPIWWRWYYWASPVAWSIYGLVTSQMGKNMDKVEIPGEDSITVKAYLEKFLGYDYNFLGVVAAVHVGWVILFFFVFSYGIKFLNFQRR